MKQVMKIMAAAIALFAVSFGAQAKDNKQQNSRPSREQFVQTQANEIANDLMLDESVAKQFVETFTKCQKEIWNCGPRHEMGKKARKASVTTDAEAEQIIKERFEHRNKINAIQEKYYKEYSKFLNQRQILKLYDLENKMMRKMFKQHAKNHAKKSSPRKGFNTKAQRCDGAPCPPAAKNAD